MFCSTCVICLGTSYRVRLGSLKDVLFNEKNCLQSTISATVIILQEDSRWTLWLVFLGLLFLACWERLATNDSGTLVAEGSNVLPSSPSSTFPYMFIRIKLKVEKLEIFL